MLTPNKKVILDLSTVDGNAFMIMGAFRQAARKQGWDEDEIRSVLKKAQFSDYDNLVMTIQDFCTDV